MRDILKTCEFIVRPYSKIDDVINNLTGPRHKNLGFIIAVSPDALASYESDEENVVIPSEVKSFFEGTTKAKKNKLDLIGFYKDIPVITMEVSEVCIYIVHKSSEIYTKLHEFKRKNT